MNITNPQSTATDGSVRYKVYREPEFTDAGPKETADRFYTDTDMDDGYNGNYVYSVAAYANGGIGPVRVTSEACYKRRGYGLLYKGGTGFTEGGHEVPIRIVRFK